MSGNAKLLVFAIWLCFLIRGVFYATAFPMWEGFDEYGHFAVIEHIFFFRDIPDSRTAQSSHLITESRTLVPAAWILRNAQQGLLPYEDYWALPEADRLARQAHLRNLPSAWAGEVAEPELRLYEAQQAPLYYWLMLPIYWAVRSMPLPEQVWTLRCVTLLLASIAIPVSWAIAARFFANERARLAVALVVASMPQLAIDAFRISNEGLAIAIGSAATLVVIRAGESARTWRFGIVAGLTLGAALLTKAYFLALLPWAVVVLMKSNRKQAMAAAVSCLIVAGWYYERVIRLTGTITGEQNDIGAGTSSVSWTEAIRTMPWRRILDFIVTSHIWLGNWSFIGARTWMYRAIEFTFVLAIAGLVLQCMRPRKRLSRPRPVGILAVPFVLLAAGLVYHSVQSFRSAGNSGSMGYYLLCMVDAEAVLLFAGLARTLPEGYELWAVPSLAVLFNALEQYGTMFLLIPYYAGIIQHDARARLPALRISQLAHGESRRLIENLAANGPEFASPVILAILMALSSLAAVALVVIAWSIARTKQEQPALQ
jgi:4-amino-4-deoxy-L-arabinose transferase-like glycosyltransferase